MRSLFYFTLILLSSFSLVSCQNYGKEKTFNGVQLFYTSGVTEAEVNKLGQYLIDNEFADGNEKTVQINKAGNVYEFRMVVKKGLENDPEYTQEFKNFAGHLSVDVFNGSHVDLHACDEYLKTLRVFPMQLPEEEIYEGDANP